MSPALQWTESDRAVVDAARVLAMDAVERAGHGHPGTAMSLAPAASLLFQRHLVHDPADPSWLGRDRFVLSPGHTSLTLYTQLFLSGYGLTLADLEAFRTAGSATPGHPEWGHTAGVETTTGPLGQGVGNAVGMAMAARRTRMLLDPDAPVGQSVFDHHVYVLASDGDLQEGVSGEACSLAGTQELGNLTLLWDDNRISIEGRTDVAFTEDVPARYAAYGWHVQEVDWTVTGEYVEDVEALDAALAAARAETSRPSFIRLRTIIGWPAPTKQDTGPIHGSKLGAEEVAATRAALGWEHAPFQVPEEIVAHARQVADRGAAARAAWQVRFEAWQQGDPERAGLLDRLRARTLPDGWDAGLPTFEVGAEVATRSASGKVLTALAEVLPELWGGSADLAGSNNTTPAGQPSFLPAHRSTDDFQGDLGGRVLHFGIREHAMGAICNGIVLHGLTRPYAGTFLVFSDYMRGAVRLAALMGLPVTYVWTHDSIGLGEDGPTHQPVEHLTSLRAIPNLDVIRPADGNETVYAWAEVQRRNTLPGTPAALALTRQNVPVLPGTSAEGVARGGYVLADADGTPDVVVLATGSEVQLALAAKEALEGEVAVRVVSMPCQEWFAAQPRDYRDQVLPPQVTARVSVEAGIGMSWRHLIGDRGVHLGVETYGASADPARLFADHGLTVDDLVAAIRELTR
ncbi:MAG: transketolase [Nitriliruptoraceae bacterium]